MSNLHRSKQLGAARPRVSPFWPIKTPASGHLPPFPQARSRPPMIYAVAVARVDRSTNRSMENVLHFGASYRHEYRTYPLTCAVFGPLSNDRKGA
jgi:hypothetical protein